MGKQQKPAPQVAAAHSRKPASLAAVVLGGLAAFAIGAGATYLLAAEPQPLGVPVPRPPRPMFSLTKPQGGGSWSLIHHRLPTGWLGRLAPQPDGLPYLHEHYQSEKLGFSIRYPYGVENVEFGMDSFLHDSVDSQAKVKIDQPLAAIKVSLPDNGGKPQLDFARQLLDSALKNGAKPVDEPHAVTLPGGGFVTIAYRRDDPDNNYVHRLYLADAKKRVLIFDFFLRPDTASEGQRYAEKIMQTFDPGNIIGQSLEVPPPRSGKPGPPAAGEKPPVD